MQASTSSGPSRGPRGGGLLAECQTRWLTTLAQTTEPECMSILYAKSLLNPGEQQPAQQRPSPAGPHRGAQRIFVGNRDPQGAAARPQRASTPPLKPQRCIARMTSSGTSNVMTASTPADFFRAHFADCDATNDSYSSQGSRCSDNQSYSGTKPLRMAPRTVASSDYSRWAPRRAQSSNFGAKSGPRVGIRLGASCSDNSYASNSRTEEEVSSGCSTRPLHQDPRIRMATNDDDLRRSPIALLSAHENVTLDASVSEYARLPTIGSENADEGALGSEEDVPRGKSLLCTAATQTPPAHAPSTVPIEALPSTYRCGPQDSPPSVTVTESICSECGRKSRISEMSRSQDFDSNQTICIPSPQNGFKNFASSSESSQGSPLRGSMPQLNSSATTAIDESAFAMPVMRTNPPSYSQLRIIRRGNRTTSQVFLNESPLSSFREPRTGALMTNSLDQRCSRTNVAEKDGVAAAWLQSPPSVDTASNSSVDSGQGSGEASSHGHSSKELSDSVSSFNVFTSKNLPSYVRMASTMDHVLRTSSAIYATLNQPSSAHSVRELVTKGNIFIQIVETSPLSPHLPTKDIAYVRQIMSELMVELSYSNRATNAAGHFTVVLRKLLEQVLAIFARVIARYLLECTNKDRLLAIALEHLIHLMLFGDEICLETVKCGGLNAILSFCEMPATPADTLRLLLRALAVLCGVSKGCIKLISLGGFEVILHILCVSSVACAVEAAGVLTQLTNPAHNFVRCQSSFAHIIARLLDIIDECVTAESLLLCSAAVANLASQRSCLVECLYIHNATCRLITAMKRPHCETIFVQEQIATIFSREATAGYEEALIAQGAIPVLLGMLSTTHATHAEYCRRIRYKAAACLATIASKGVGLRAIFEQNGYASLSKVLQNEKLASEPAGLLCGNVRELLERKYQIESAV